MLKGYFNTLQSLRRPDARLVRMHSTDPASNGYFVLPGGLRVGGQPRKPSSAARTYSPMTGDYSPINRSLGGFVTGNPCYPPLERWWWRTSSSPFHPVATRSPCAW